jgi:hypothetical protein
MSRSAGAGGAVIASSVHTKRSVPTRGLRGYGQHCPLGVGTGPHARNGHSAVRGGQSSRAVHRADKRGQRPRTVRARGQWVAPRLRDGRATSWTDRTLPATLRRMSQRTALNCDQMTLERARRSAGDPLPNARRDDDGPLDAISRRSVGGPQGRCDSLVRRARTTSHRKRGHNADPDRQRAEPDVRASGSGSALRRASRPPNLEIGPRDRAEANCAYRAALDREQAAARDLESLSQLAHAA